MDTWATSSLTPLIHAPPRLPATGGNAAAHEPAHPSPWDHPHLGLLHHRAQPVPHRQVPWKQIMISGFVLAKSGRYSKSQSQGADMPMDLIETPQRRRPALLVRQRQVGHRHLLQRQQDLQGLSA